MKTICFKRSAILLLIVMLILICAFIPEMPAYASESAVTSPGAIVSPQGSTVTDYSNESNAGLRMQPMRHRLAELTPEEIEKEAARFGDIAKHWSKAQDAKLSALGIIKGYSDGTFKPEAPLTVAEFVTMTVKALGYKPEINQKFWAQNFIDQAIKDGLFGKGYFNNYSRPVTREEVASLAVNAVLQYDKAPAHELDNVVRGRIKDYTEVNDKLKQSVIDVYRMGLMSPYGSSGKFMPKNSLTRAEGATVILRLLDDGQRAMFIPKKDEMIEVTNRYSKEKVVLTCTNGAEVLPMTYKIIEAAKKSKGYVEITSTYAKDGLGILFWDKKENSEDLDRAPDMTIDVGLTGGNSFYPYTLILRRPANVKAFHMGFMEELFNMFYEGDGSKVITEFKKILDSAIKGDERFYRIWTYETGIKYNNRGILLERGKYDPEMVIWIYNKL